VPVLVLFLCGFPCFLHTIRENNGSSSLIFLSFFFQRIRISGTALNRPYFGSRVFFFAMPLVVFYHGRKKHFSRNMEGSTQLRRTKKRNAKHESHLKRVSKPWRSWKQKLFKSITHEKPSKQKPNREIVTRVDKKINVPRQKNFIQKKTRSSSRFFFSPFFFTSLVHFCCAGAFKISSGSSLFRY